jgi:chromosome segregation ATPase
METAASMARPRSTERLRQALTALGALLHQTINEMETLDSDLLQVAQETEATAQRQAEEHLLGLKEAERNSRAQVTEELKTRFDAKVAELEAELRKFSRERENLIRDFEQRLADAQGNWESERARLEADGEQANRLLTEGKEELRRAQSAGEELSREVQRLRHSKEDWDAERSHLLAERDSANQAASESKDEFFRMLSDTQEAAALALDRQIATAVERVRGECATEALRARQELEREWLAEREQLTRELEHATQQLSEVREEHSRALAEKEKSLAQALTRDTAAVAERARAQLAEETAALRKQLEMEHSRVLAETKKSLTAAFDKDKSAAVDRVRAELTRERDGLRLEVERLNKAAVEWQSEQKKLTVLVENLNRQIVESNAEIQRLASDTSKGKAAPGAVAAEVLLEEIARVEKVLEKMSALIKNPGTELSVVMRTNVERNELESYLRGIRFSLFGT